MVKYLRILILLVFSCFFLNIDLKGQVDSVFEREFTLFYMMGGDADSTFWDNLNLKNNDTLSITYSSNACINIPVEYKIEVLEIENTYKSSILLKKKLTEENWEIVKKKELTRRDKFYLKFVLNKLEEASKKGWLCTNTDEYVFTLKNEMLFILKDETCELGAFYKISKSIFDVTNLR